MDHAKLDKCLELMRKLADCESTGDADEVVIEIIEFVRDVDDKCDFCLGPKPCHCMRDE